MITPGVYSPRSFEYSSIIQPIICGVVPTSGAGTSCAGPMFFHIWSTQPRHSRSFSVTDSVEGSTTTPPLPPPSGMSATAHFHVIHVASARTVSIVS